MKQLTPVRATVFATALLAATLTAQAADVARTATASTPPAKATSSPTAKPANNNKPGGATPAAGGSNSGSVTDGSNTGTQVKPKVPKCPDPNETACAAAKVQVK